MLMKRAAGSAFGAACLFGLVACDHFDVREAASHLPPYQHALDRPKSVLDTALDHCPDKTEEREAVCVKQAVADRPSVAALAALVPGCHLGKICSYRYTTDDRLGYVEVMAEDFKVHWRVGFDLRHARTPAEVPITVTQE